MKKKTISLCILALSLFTAGCGTSASTAQESPAAESAATENSESQSEADTQEVTRDTETEAEEVPDTETTETTEEADEDSLKTSEKVSQETLAAYSEVLDAYTKAWGEKADADTLSADALSPLLSYYYDQTDVQTGYLLYDLGGDETEELIIAANEPDGQGGSKSRVLQLYSIYKGEAVCLYTGEERNPAYIMRNGNAFDLYETDSDGAAETFYYQYEVSGDYLYNAVEIAYSEEKDAENPWFFVDGENFEPADEAAAMEMISAMEASILKLELTGF